MTECLVEREEVAVWHADWRGLLDALPRRDDGTVCDLLCTDCPYSERTHAGHDSTSAGHAGAGGDGANRRHLSYGAWDDDCVHAFVDAWAPVTRGWIVSVTDHVLAPSWAARLEGHGRLAFPPVPFLAPGSRVRLSGDGPSCWTCQVVVARPRVVPFARWGTLPGGYVLPPGLGERMPVVGGKPLWLMERLVEDYSRPGDLVCDPCCGAGTTLEAALRTGRRAVGGDQMREHAELSAARVSRPVQRPLLGAVEETREATQADLFAQVTDEGEAA